MWGYGVGARGPIGQRDRNETWVWATVGEFGPTGPHICTFHYLISISFQISHIQIKFKFLFEFSDFNSQI
jgi:hypothetical protein